MAGEALLCDIGDICNGMLCGYGIGALLKCGDCMSAGGTNVVGAWRYVGVGGVVGGMTAGRRCRSSAPGECLNFALVLPLSGDLDLPERLPS